MKLSLIGGGMILGTYIAQALTHQNWARAFDVSWTTAMTLIGVWISMKIMGVEFRKSSLPTRDRT